jgi:hypothetical protein
VVGLEPDAKYVVLADPNTGDKFRIPVDDTLRAASRGDLARLGQIQIETTSQLRPREIQARIRGGASVEQVSQEAGIPIAKVERFAYPVLLERSRAADMAKKGHPVRPDGPTVETLLEIVTQAFRARGHNLDEATWDAWRDDDGHWYQLVVRPYMTTDNRIDGTTVVCFDISSLKRTQQELMSART